MPDDLKCPHCGASGKLGRSFWTASNGAALSSEVRLYDCGHTISGCGHTKIFLDVPPTHIACTCSIVTLSAKGCQCGAMQREREMR